MKRRFGCVLAVVFGCLVPGVGLAQIDSGSNPWPGPWDGPRWIPSGPWGRFPSVWEGGTNVTPDDPEHQTWDRSADTRDSRRNRSNEQQEPDPCAATAVTLLPDQGPAGQLAFVPGCALSPLAGQEVWTWATRATWPARFEVRPDLPLLPLVGSQTSWAFPSLPFDLDAPGPWLREVEVQRGDRLYEVERVDADGTEVIAWFWFQAGESWSQIAYADLSLDDLFIHLAPGEVLRFSAIEPWQLPWDAEVFIAADE